MATVEVTRIKHNTKRLAHKIMITSTVNTVSVCDLLVVVLLFCEAVDPCAEVVLVAVVVVVVVVAVSVVCVVVH